MTDFLKPVQVLHNGLWIQTVKQGATMTDFKLPIQVNYSGKWIDATVVHLFSSGRAVVVCGPSFNEVAVTFDRLNRDIRNTPPAAELVAFDRETIPKGALWRGAPGKIEWADGDFLEVLRYGVTMVFLRGYEMSYGLLLTTCEYSTDNGETWWRAGRLA